MQSEYLALVYIGAGCSWACEETISGALTKAVIRTVGGWSHLFDFYGEELPVHIYDITGMTKIIMSPDGVFCVDKEPREEGKFLETVKVQIPELKDVRELKDGRMKRKEPAHMRLLEEAAKKAYPQ
jgi:hypothetical protein